MTDGISMSETENERNFYLSNMELKWGCGKMLDPMYIKTIYIKTISEDPETGLTLRLVKMVFTIFSLEM